MKTLTLKQLKSELKKGNAYYCLSEGDTEFTFITDEQHFHKEMESYIMFMGYDENTQKYTADCSFSEWVESDEFYKSIENEICKLEV